MVTFLLLQQQKPSRNGITPCFFFRLFVESVWCWEWRQLRNDKIENIWIQFGWKERFCWRWRHFLFNAHLWTWVQWLWTLAWPESTSFSNILILFHWDWAPKQKQITNFRRIVSSYEFVSISIAFEGAYTHTALRNYNVFRVFSTWTTTALRIDHTHTRYTAISVIAHKSSEFSRQIKTMNMGVSVAVDGYVENHVLCREPPQTIATSLNHRCSHFFVPLSFPILDFRVIALRTSV